MERLKALSLQKFTLDGRKFPTLTVLCKIPTSSTVNTTWFVQFVRMAPVAVTELNSKKSEKFKSTAPNTIL